MTTAILIIAAVAVFGAVMAGLLSGAVAGIQDTVDRMEKGEDERRDG